MTKLTPWAALAMVPSLLACSTSDQVTGNGQLVSDTRTVEAFSRVSIEGNLRAEVTVGTNSVSLLMDSNLLSLVKTTVHDGTLTIAAQDGSDVTPSTGALIQLRTPQLSGLSTAGAAIARAELNGTDVSLDSSGSSDLTATLDAPATLSAESAGSSQIHVLGTVSDQSLTTNENSTLESEAPSQTSTVSASGSSALKLTASERVQGEASGASEVTVNGQPKERSVAVSGQAKVLFP